MVLDWDWKIQYILQPKFAILLAIWYTKMLLWVCCLVVASNCNHVHAQVIPTIHDSHISSGLYCPSTGQVGLSQKSPKNPSPLTLNVLSRPTVPWDGRDCCRDSHMPPNSLQAYPKSRCFVPSQVPRHSCLGTGESPEHGLQAKQLFILRWYWAQQHLLPVNTTVS